MRRAIHKAGLPGVGPFQLRQLVFHPLKAVTGPLKRAPRQRSELQAQERRTSSPRPTPSGARRRGSGGGPAPRMPRKEQERQSDQEREAALLASTIETVMIKSSLRQKPEGAGAIPCEPLQRPRH